MINIIINIILILFFIESNTKIQKNHIKKRNFKLYNEKWTVYEKQDDENIRSFSDDRGIYYFLNKKKINVLLLKIIKKNPPNWFSIRKIP